MFAQYSVHVCSHLGPASPTDGRRTMTPRHLMRKLDRLYAEARAAKRVDAAWRATIAQTRRLERFGADAGVPAAPAAPGHLTLTATARVPRGRPQTGSGRQLDERRAETLPTARRTRRLG
jgi:hypothetical protein